MGVLGLQRQNISRMAIVLLFGLIFVFANMVVVVVVEAALEEYPEDQVFVLAIQAECTSDALGTSLEEPVNEAADAVIASSLGPFDDATNEVLPDDDDDCTVVRERKMLEELLELQQEEKELKQQQQQYTRELLNLCPKNCNAKTKRAYCVVLKCVRAKSRRRWLQSSKDPQCYIFDTTVLEEKMNNILTKFETKCNIDMGAEFVTLESYQNASNVATPEGVCTSVAEACPNLELDDDDAFAPSTPPPDQAPSDAPQPDRSAPTQCPDPSTNCLARLEKACCTADDKPTCRDAFMIEQCEKNLRREKEAVESFNKKCIKTKMNKNKKRKRKRKRNKAKRSIPLW